MQAKSFLLLNALVVLVLVLRLFMARKQTKPTSLHIDKPSYPAQAPSANPTNFPSSNDEKSLNCYFMHNGLMMDAFEVLGVPAGSNQEACYRAYVDLRRKFNKTPSPEVVEHAWGALQKYFS